uniref:glycophorin-C isoform X2 n=1 Tax=Macaca mulatta TaxID=9544 RepID=UPI0010A29029|nr:glycophorin-C isoform X2 [Macaca mulatta]
MPRTSSPNGTARPLSLGPYPGVTSASTTMDITTIDSELSSHSPTTMYTSITAGPYPGVTSASTTMDITTTEGEVSSQSPTTMYTSITAGPYPGVTHALTTTDIAIIAGPLCLPTPLSRTLRPDLQMPGSFLSRCQLLRSLLWSLHLLSSPQPAPSLCHVTPSQVSNKHSLSE